MTAFFSPGKLNDHHLSGRHDRIKVWIFKTHKGITKVQAPYMSFLLLKFNSGPNVQ